MEITFKEIQGVGKGRKTEWEKEKGVNVRMRGFRILVYPQQAHPQQALVRLSSADPQRFQRTR